MDELIVIGIDEKGYGKVYKIVMRNPTVPLTAKALYAYFCSYAGSGTTAFPHREKIIRDMKITKNTFTKHLNFLVAARYIARKRTAMGNIYSILLTVPNKENEEVEVKSMGYGTIPKFAMLDKRLTANAKGIYAYLCSYAGSGNIAYPRRSTILRELDISEGKYYRHFNALTECGYVTPAQGTGDRGRYSSSTYTLNEVLGIHPSIDPNEVASESDSQKMMYGEEPINSQKRRYGELLSFNMVFNNQSQKQGYGGEAMSQKQMSRQSVSPKPGHPITSNRSYNKHSSSIEEDEINNIRARAHGGDDEKSSFSALSKERVKELAHYDYLIEEFDAWATLKDTLGHFTGPQGKTVYLANCKVVCDEFVYQLELFFGRTAKFLEHNGGRYEQAQLMENLKSAISNPDETFETVCRLVECRPDIRNLRAYMKQSVINLAIESR